MVLLRIVFALAIVAVSITQAAPLGLRGMSGPGGFALHQMLSNLGQRTRQQSSGPSTSFKYLLDEEEAGYFRGKWYECTYLNFTMSNMHCNGFAQ